MAERPTNTAADTFLQTTYPELYSKAKHMIAKPGDKISIAGLDWRLVSSAGEVITAPLPGTGKPNPYCADFKPKDKNDDGGVENTMSVGSVITFGKFRMAHLGDLTWNKEFDMMCRSIVSGPLICGGFTSWTANVEFGSACACDPARVPS